MTETQSPSGKIQGITVLVLIVGLVGFAVWKNRKAFDSTPPGKNSSAETKERKNSDRQIEGAASQLEKEQAEREARLKVEQETVMQAEQQRLALEEQLRTAEEEKGRHVLEQAAQEQTRREEEERRIAQVRQEERESVMRQLERERVDRETKERAARESVAKILQQLLKPNGMIQEVWVEENVSELFRKGMRIHIRSQVDNLQNALCHAAAYFEFASGQPLRDYDTSYSSNDGYVAAVGRFTPVSASEQFDDFRIFVPYRELHLEGGKYQLRYIVKLYRIEDSLFFAESSYQYFDMENGSFKRISWLDEWLRRP